MSCCRLLVWSGTARARARTRAASRSWPDACARSRPMTTAIAALRPFAPNTQGQPAAANEPAAPVALHADDMRTGAVVASPDAHARAVVAARAAEIAERARLRREW